MKNFAIKVLITALNLFSRLIISKLNSEWVKKVATLAVNRLDLFAKALTDSDPDNTTQLEKIARETLVSPELLDLEAALTQELVNKIPNPKLGQLLLLTEQLRIQFLTVLADEDKNNAAQLQSLALSFLKTEEFDSVAIAFAELLADKYAKDDLAKQFVVELVTELVNSDDQN